MNKICTTLEQSKKLKELGIDINTADMYYYTVNGDWEWYETPNIMESIDDLNEHTIPAWSISALIELFDDKAGLTRDYGLWFCYDNGKSHCTKHYENPVDAAFEMVVWLNENGKL